jgi:hypothetical protein
MQEAVNQYGLAKGAGEALTTQPLRMVWSSITKDPTYGVLQAFPATMAIVAKSMGNVGVLTEPDQKRVEAALSPRSTDTSATYAARMGFIEQALRRGQRELEKATQSGQAPNSANLGDITFDGDPLPPGKASSRAPSDGNQGGNRKAMAEAIRNEQDPVKKRALAAEYVKMFPQQ